MIVGCYDLHLYCDGISCSHGDFGQRAEFEMTDENGSTCRKKARKRGWRLFKSGHALCPPCVKAGTTLDPEAF